MLQVLDLRTIAPLDRDAILASISKTGRLVIVDEDYDRSVLAAKLSQHYRQDPRLLKTEYNEFVTQMFRFPIHESLNIQHCQHERKSKLLFMLL